MPCEICPVPRPWRLGPPNGGGFETLWPIIILSPHIQVFAIRLQQHSPGPGKPLSHRLLGAVLVWQPASLSGLWAALAVEAVAGTVGMDDAFFVPNEVPETDNETLVRLDGELKGTTMLEKPRVSKKVGKGVGGEILYRDRILNHAVVLGPGKHCCALVVWAALDPPAALLAAPD